jgi:hypothetical protein
MVTSNQPTNQPTNQSTSYVLNLDDFSNFLVDRCYQFKLRYLELNILNLAPPIPRSWRVAKVTYAVIMQLL